MADASDQDRIELLTLYQTTTEDIERAKQWGWTVTYTTIAAQGGVLALSIAYESSLNIWHEKAIFAALVIGFALVWKGLASASVSRSELHSKNPTPRSSGLSRQLFGHLL